MIFLQLLSFSIFVVRTSSGKMNGLIKSEGIYPRLKWSWVLLLYKEMLSKRGQHSLGVTLAAIIATISTKTTTAQRRVRYCVSSMDFCQKH